MMPKYQIGQKIKHVNDPDVDSGPIVHISIDGSRVLYTFTVEEWNPEERKSFIGRKHIYEDEAVLMP